MATKQKRTKTTRARAARKSTKAKARPRAAAKAKTTAAKVRKAAKRTTAPRKQERDPRLPAAGTVLKRPYKGKEIRVTVLEEGFRWERKEYRSLSALAAAITGAKSINGFLWFRMTEQTPKPARKPASGPKGRGPKGRQGEAAAAAKAGQDPTHAATDPAATEGATG